MDGLDIGSFWLSPLASSEVALVQPRFIYVQENISLLQQLYDLDCRLLPAHTILDRIQVQRAPLHLLEPHVQLALHHLLHLMFRHLKLRLLIDVGDDVVQRVQERALLQQE